MIVATTESAQALAARLAAKARRLGEARQARNWRDAQALWPLFGRGD